MTQRALGLLDAIAQADLGRALALADTAGDALELVDEAIAVVGERLRTGQAPREAVAAIRALWELRYRLSVTNVPIATALPVLVAEVAAVMADLERQAHPLQAHPLAEFIEPADLVHLVDAAKRLSDGA